MTVTSHCPRRPSSMSFESSPGCRECLLLSGSPTQLFFQERERRLEWSSNHALGFMQSSKVQSSPAPPFLPHLGHDSLLKPSFSSQIEHVLPDQLAAFLSCHRAEQKHDQIMEKWKKPHLSPDPQPWPVPLLLHCSCSDQCVLTTQADRDTHTQVFVDLKKKKRRTVYCVPSMAHFPVAK